MQQAALQEKTLHQQVIANLQKERDTDLHDFKIAIKKKEDEAKLLHDVVELYDQQLQNKKKKWYQKLFSRRQKSDICK